jgi:biopolymer transport protein ExbD
MKLTRTVKLNPYLVFLTPLADLICLMLLLFLVSSTFLLHSGINVSLPFSKFTLGPEQNPVVIAVTAGPYPTIYYQDQQVALNNLGQQLDQSGSKDKSVIIRADKMTPQGIIVQVMNLCLERGYSVVLATAPRDL